ncbi:hypothetical protein KCU87_g449, partial [Aureobasidium melanogenum]
MTKFLARFLCNEWLYALTATPSGVRCEGNGQEYLKRRKPSESRWHIGCQSAALLRKLACLPMPNALLPVASLFSVAFSLSRGVVPGGDWCFVRVLGGKETRKKRHGLKEVLGAGGKSENEDCLPVNFPVTALLSSTLEDKTPARRTLQYIEKNTLECCKYCTSQLLGCGSSCIGWVVKSSNSFCVRFARHSPSSNILYQSLEKANASTKQIVLSDWELRGTDDGSETADVVVNGEQSTACQKRPDSFRVNGHQRLHESNNVNQKIQ